MIHDKYKKLLGMLEQAADSKEFTLEDILKEAVIFFEILRKEFKAASKEEKEEMAQMMTHLHSRLQEIAERTAKASGMTEEELSAYSEDPSNFSPEQWKLVQETKRELYDSAKKLSSSTEKEGKESQSPDVKPPKKKSPSSRARRTRRSDWTKS